MCCIFGIGLLKDHKIENKDSLIGMVSTLAREAQSGGRAASGVSIMREKTARVFKRPISSSELVLSDDFQNFMDEQIVLDHPENKTLSIIGHTRLPTKGTTANNNNNHPIIINHIIGVHNGIISNDDMLFTRFKDDFDRVAQVDTEIIFQLLAHFSKEREDNTIDAIEKVSSYLSGGYACAAQNANHPYNLYLFRSSNPIRAIMVKSLGIVMFATRLHFMVKALQVLDHEPDMEELEIVNEAGMVFNLNNRTYSKFMFPRSKNA